MCMMERGGELIMLFMQINFNTQPIAMVSW